MKKTNNHITELVFILDRSGSMGGLESDTIGGFNAMLEKQKQQDGTAYVSTVLFDHETEVLHALLDAIGKSVHHIGNIHKYARPEDVPEHTMFVITTDGMENASREYSGKAIKKLIEKQKKNYGWEFLFIGANIDAIATARSFGIAEDRAVNYKADKKGTGVVYGAVSKAVSAMRREGSVAPCWSQEIAEDYENRN